ncbi:MAG: hypothetical protein EOO98_15630 [Pedobacter sp.]|nr:MAG: hypothetical protein EOO98_15630 [Pedobacter sp.]
MVSLWDNVWNGGNTFHTKPGSGLPQYFTFDLGVSVNLSRFKFYHRRGGGQQSTDGAYFGGDPKIFDLYGSNAPAQDGSWESWTLIGEFESLKNKDLVVGGLVVLASQRITKTGKPFGIFVFEDYDDSCEIALFGDDFLKFKQYLTEGYFLQIRGRVGERFRKEGDWEFKVMSIDLLSELRDKLTKCITIQVPIEEVNSDFMQKIDMILQENKENSERHNCKLNFAVYDKAQNIILEMPSKSLRINPNNQFLEQLTNLNVVNYKLN